MTGMVAEGSAPLGRAVRHPFGWVSAFAVGVTSAVAAEVAIGMLLYAGSGFVRSLTIILTVESAALAAGLWMPYPTPEPVDGLRRRWLFAMVSLLVATVFGTVWTLVPGVGGGSLGQGFGLAMLAGLPLYACGALLGGLAHEARDVGGGRSRVAALGAVGAAAGFALTGFLLPRAPTPSSLLVACLVILSLGGMTYGAARVARGRKRVVAQGCLGPPPVRVEEWVRPGGDRAEWVLLEGDVVRAVRSPDDADDGVPWDVDLVLASAPPEPGPWRVLLVGGGASTAPEAALRRHPSAEVTVLERAHCVVELGRSHFGTRDGERLRVLTGNLEDGLRDLDGRFDLIVVDGRALDAVGGLSALSRDGRRCLTDLLAPGGLMAWGPKVAHHPRELAAPEWEARRRDPTNSLAEVLVLRRTAGASTPSAPVDGGPTIP
ncbi:MAG: hypothetical protein WD995_01905 [Gemmatimonadota bacterium]